MTPPETLHRIPFYLNEESLGTTLNGGNKVRGMFLTRIDSRRVGAGKTTAILSAAVGFSALNPDTEVILVIEHTEIYVKKMTDAGIFPMNLKVMNESAFLQERRHRGNGGRKCTTYFYDSGQNWDKVLDILLEDSKYFGPYFVTAVDNSN